MDRMVGDSGRVGQQLVTLPALADPHDAPRALL